jgi:hypothetical protein
MIYYECERRFLVEAENYEEAQAKAKEVGADCIGRFTGVAQRADLNTVVEIINGEIK